MDLKLIIYILLLFSCKGNTQLESNNQPKPIIVGAEQIDEYLKSIRGKSIGLIVNQTSLVASTHLLDTLLKLDINVKRIFTPEHGFRGTADAGELIENGVDSRTGIPIVSLYGKNKKPKSEQLEGLDLLIFDIQDVGVRFYTYISTLHYVMEAVAEENIELLVLDRPNPNGQYIDGPVLKEKFKSFVGMHPVPVVHGMTIGEYANMINGEQWLQDSIKCELKVIPVKNYTHQTIYNLPIKPSPNLPNSKSIQLYPSLCFFEGTNVSVGRGTGMQFQHIGHPLLVKYDYSFIPKPNIGSKSPKHNGKVCYGLNLTEAFIPEQNGGLQLQYLIEFYKECRNNDFEFFTRPDFFDLLAGTDQLRLDIERDLSLEEIKEKWKEDLGLFKSMREKYLLYPD